METCTEQLSSMGFCAAVNGLRRMPLANDHVQTMLGRFNFNHRSAADFFPFFSILWATGFFTWILTTTTFKFISRISSCSDQKLPDRPRCRRIPICYFCTERYYLNHGYDICGREMDLNIFSLFSSLYHQQYNSSTNKWIYCNRYGPVLWDCMWLGRTDWN